MATFTYTARDSAGNSVTGEINAASQSDAARLIRADGKFVVKIQPGAATKHTRPAPTTPKATSDAKPAPAAATAPALKASVQSIKPASIGPGSAATGPARPATGNKFKADDVIFFTNQLAVMVETGVSLADALEACEHEGNSPRFARALAAVIESVRGGSEFSAALAEHPKVFGPLYVSLIKASEASGMMAQMLRRMASHLENQRDMKKKLKGAVTYPIVMFTFAIGVTVFMVTFVLPKFTAIYAGREDKLPFITRTLLSLSDFVTAYGFYLLGAIVAAGVGAFLYIRTPGGGAAFEALRLKLPLVGPMFHKTYLTRSLRTLGTMLQSGVSMLDGIELTAKSCGSRHYESMWRTVYARLETGQQLTDALGDQRAIPKAINKMLGAGERGGQLGSVMDRVANFCEAELNIAIKTLTGLLEPAIIMFLGAVVGGLVLALLLPIFTISKAMH